MAPSRSSSVPIAYGPDPPAVSPTSARSINEHVPASVVSGFGTPRSSRVAPTAHFDLTREEMDFAERMKRRKDETPYSARSSISALGSRGATPPSAVSIEPREVFSFARHGKLGHLQSALLSGFPVNSRDEHGNTLFIVACQNGQKKIGNFLADFNADLNAQNKIGNTGLHFLYAFGYLEIAKDFEARGADPRLKNAAGLMAVQGIKTR